MRRTTMRPRARRGDLLVREIGDETIVYDLQRDKAHCLNRTAAQVWNQCDGHATVAQIADRMAEQVSAPVNEVVVRLGLRQLGRARLLEEPSLAVKAGCTRREAAHHLGRGAVAAFLLPSVLSIVAPSAAQAATCVPNAPGCLPNGTSCGASSACCSCCCGSVGAGQICTGAPVNCLPG